MLQRWKETQEEHDFSLVVLGDGAGGQLVVPEDGLRVDTGEMREYSRELSGVELEVDEAPVLPMHVKVEVRNVSEVELQQRSMVAPHLSLLLSGVNKVTLSPKAVIPFTNPEISHLELIHIDHAIFKTESVTIGHLNITKVNKLEMQNGAIEILNFGTIGEGGTVHIETVQDAVLGENALIIPPGSSLTMQNVLVGRAGRRAISVRFSPLNHMPSLLSHITLNHVVFEHSKPIAFCLSAAYTTLTDLLVMRGFGEAGNVTKTVCASASKDLRATTFRDVTPNSVVASAAVVCTSQQPPPSICPDPLCHPCQPPELTATEAPTTEATTTVVTTTTSLTTAPVPGNKPTLSTTTALNTLTPAILIQTSPKESANDNGGEDPAYLPYAIPLVVLAAIAFLLIIYCIYKLRKKGKCAQYKLPRTTARHTFPRTIVTRETLNRDPPPPSVYPPPQNKELFVTFSASPMLPANTSILQQASCSSDKAYVAEAEPILPQGKAYSDSHDVSSNHSESYSQVNEPCSLSDDITNILQNQCIQVDEDQQDDQLSSSSSQELPPYGYINPITY